MANANMLTANMLMDNANELMTNVIMDNVLNKLIYLSIY